MEISEFSGFFRFFRSLTTNFLDPTSNFHNFGKENGKKATSRAEKVPVRCLYLVKALRLGGKSPGANFGCKLVSCS
jgi:hypothetical protein